MKREIKIFNSFEEQEQYQLLLMRQTTPLQRFKTLFELQQWTKALQKKDAGIRKIVIQKNGHS